MQTLAATSIGSKVPQRNFEGVVSGSFERTCNLTLQDRAIITCAVKDHFNMPRGIVIETSKEFKFNQFIAGGTPSHCRGNIVRFANSDIKLDLRDASIWQPDFTSIAKPSNHLILKLWQNTEIFYKSLMSNWAHHKANLPVQDLIGRGPGLTPLGDDILTGALSALSLLGQPMPDITHALHLTNDISRQMLSDAAEGQIIESIISLMAALYNDQPIEQPVQELLKVGSMSGAAMLLGVIAGIAHSENYQLSNPIHLKAA